MTRTARKLLAAAALTTGMTASAGSAGACPAPAIKLVAASLQHTAHWNCSNGKQMPDQCRVQTPPRTAQK